MLIKTTEPKLSSRAKWSESAGTWQPGWFGMQASYQQCSPNATFTPAQCVNGVQTLSPLATAETPAVPLHAVPRSEAEGILDP